MGNKNCTLCYGTGKKYDDKQEVYVECPNCKDLPVEPKPIILNKKDVNCGLCYGTGKTFNTVNGNYEVCPKCNTIDKLFNESPLEAYEKIGEELKIPIEYRAEQPVQSIRELGDIGNSQESCSFIDAKLSELMNSFMKRTPLKESFILSLKPHMDNDYVAYSLMQFAVERSLTVLPYITITDLLGLQHLYGLTKEEFNDLNKGVNINVTNINDLLGYDGVRVLKEYGKTYYDFIHDEVCFIKIPANPPAQSFFALADLIQNRASKNLATYVMSYSFPYMYKTGGLAYLLNKKHKPSLKKLTELSLLNNKITHSTDTYAQKTPPVSATGMAISDL